MKRMLGILICLLMASLLSACSEEEFSYAIDASNGAIITQYRGHKTELIVPSVLGGYPVKSIGLNAFGNNQELTLITLPEGLESIAAGAFHHCASLTSIKLPKGLDFIGERAFSACENLASIVLPEGLETIGSYAFGGCNLKKVKLPNSIKSMGSNPFRGCGNLSAISVKPDHPFFTQVDGVLFNHVDHKLISYPVGKKERAYIVPDGTKSIGSFAISSSNLTSITFPKGLESIDDNAVPWNQMLTSITFCEGLKTIGANAFEWCKSVTSISLAEGLENIGSFAFEGCLNLTTVKLPDSVMTMGSNPFAVCNELEEIMINSDHPVFTLIDGVLINKNEQKLIRYPVSRISGSYSVPVGILSIDDYAFFACDNLTSIALPNGLSSIGSKAFCGCDNLTSIALPNGLSSIGSYAFYDCDSLTSIILPQGLKTISDGAFGSCSQLISVTLPASLASIGRLEFHPGTLEELKMIVARNSYAEKWVKENGFPYQYSD